MLDCVPITPRFGTVVRGLRLDRLDESGLSELRVLFAARKLLVFPEQEIPAAELLSFARRWGPLDRQELAERVHPDYPEVQLLEHDQRHPPVGYVWHTDLSWSENPPLGTLLSAKVVPPCGGDTVFADMTAVYDALSPRLRDFLVGLTARHERLEHLVRRGVDPEAIATFLRRHPPVDHPVIRTHPETGERAIYVNPSFTRYINDIPGEESAAILGFLYGQTARADFQCRIQWHAGMVAFWDNRCLQHNAVGDYYPQTRRMERLVLAGDRPR
jgi:taurine dioxygenase